MTGGLLGSGVDLTAVVSALPMPCVLLTPRLVVVEVSRPYEALMDRSREQLVGRGLLDVFPQDPAHPSDAPSLVAASLLRVLDTGVAEPVPLQRYDVPSAADPARYLERWWSYTTHPVVGAYGQVAGLLLVTEDVTAVVAASERDETGASAGEATGGGTGEVVIDLRARAGELHAAVYARAERLQAATVAREIAARRLTALAEVALELAEAETREDMVAAVLRRGLRALGCDGGSIAVPDPREPGHLVSTVLDENSPTGTSTVAGVPVTNPLPVAAAFVRGERVVLADRGSALAWSPVMEQALLNTELQVLVSVPMVVGGRVLGVLTATWNDSHELADAELALLEAYAAQGAQTLERLTARAVEREAATFAASMAETLQRSLLTSPVHPEHLEVAVRYLPAVHDARIGGDWYDAFVADTCLHVAIGDVGGHDRDAAASMGQLRNLLRGITYAARDSTPAVVLGTLDAAVVDLSVDVMATIVLGRLEQSPEQRERGERTLRWSNAGHPPPVLVHPDGRAELLETAPDLLLGVERTTDRHDHTTLVKSGATLLFYTDGLVERRGELLDRGLDWLVSTLGELSSLPLDELCDALLATVGDDVEDDVALLALRALPQSGPSPGSAA